MAFGCEILDESGYLCSYCIDDDDDDDDVS